MEAARREVARRRQAWVLLGLFAFGAWLAWRLVVIQVIDHATHLEVAQRQQNKRVVISPDRGRIVDRNGIPLATNRDQFEIFLVPRHISDVERFIEDFTAIVPYDRAELRRRVEIGGWYVRLVRGVSKDVVERLEQADLNGVGVKTYQVRHYPYDGLASGILGRVDTDNKGIEGIELQYDEVLRGQPGYAIHQRDALGQEYPNFTYPVEPPIHGKDVHLTIDLGMQEAVEGALDAAMRKTNARSGSVVVVDPKTGEILAVANQTAEVVGIDSSVRNYAVIDQFEPGSTFKLVPLAALYEERLAAPTDSLFCENGLWNDNGRILEDVTPYGYLTVEEVIEGSSNICAAKLVQRLGEDQLYEYARRFGFGLPTGLDFPGEPRGVLRKPDEWSALTQASMAMGYEIMVTSIQMVMAYAAIANGGELLRPYLVRKVEGPNGEVHFESRPQRVRRVVGTETAGLVTRALVRVVEMGTAQKAQIDILPVAGKTGTARKVGEGGYERGRYTSTFAGFFPAIDARYAVFVRIDEPIGEFYGGTVAAPVFREALEGSLLTETVSETPSLVGRLRSPDRVVWSVSDSFEELLPQVVDSSTAIAKTLDPLPGSNWQRVADPPLTLGSDVEVPYVIDIAGGEETRTATFDPRARVKVPDFGGLSLREAVGQASRLGLRLEFNGTGRVANQNPEPGEVVWYGTAIQVTNP